MDSGFTSNADMDRNICYKGSVIAGYRGGEPFRNMYSVNLSVEYINSMEVVTVCVCVSDFN